MRCGSLVYRCANFAAYLCVCHEETYCCILGDNAVSVDTDNHEVWSCHYTFICLNFDNMFDVSSHYNVLLDQVQTDDIISKDK